MKILLTNRTNKSDKANMTDKSDRTNETDRTSMIDKSDILKADLAIFIKLENMIISFFKKKKVQTDSKNKYFLMNYFLNTHFYFCVEKNLNYSENFSY